MSFRFYVAYRHRFYVRAILCIVLFTLACVILKGGLNLGISSSSSAVDETVADSYLRPAYSRLQHPHRGRYEKLILKDLAKQRPGLGDVGEVVKLEGADYDKGQADLKRIALNEELSEQLSYNRTLPDGRTPYCKKKQYQLETLPTATVIIIFYNEPYSVLVRTIHSVINTAVGTGKLKEVIVVDDASTNEELLGKLDYYVETRLPKLVKILRLKKRLGLIRARLAGARAATGDVMVFLDAHCECMQQWLEPMLERIEESPTSVLVPIIDVIDATDFHYASNGYNNFQVGGFNWNGHFDWIDVPQRERERQRRECKEEHKEVCPTYSPTMAGGLLAIGRQYFWDIGSYDNEMDGWGGENLEMSFRIWQCGGTIETIPCSRIGHVFREFHPYKFPNNKDTHGINTVRMAKVWMDQYASIYLISRPDLAKSKSIGDISKRVELRKRLQCKSFQWYLNNIFPEKFVPIDNVQGYGRVENGHTKLCLDDLQQSREERFNVGVYWCHESVTSSQYFSLTNSGLLRVEEGCLTVEQGGGASTDEKASNAVMLHRCREKNASDDVWEWTEARQLRYARLNLCLDVEGLQSSDHVYVGACDASRLTQKWEIIH